MSDTNKTTAPPEYLPKPFLWSLVLLTASIAFKSFNRLEADFDLWFHIFFGEKFILTKALPRFDACSFTAFGHPVINHEWISQVIMAEFHLFGGEIGLIVWRWSIVIMITAFSLNLIRTRALNVLSRIITFLCLAVVLSPGISFRVQLFSYLFFLLLLNLIYTARAGGRLPSLLVINTLFLIWANLHGAFVFGLLIWFIYLGEFLYQGTRKIQGRKAVISFLFPVAATLVNPFGIKLWMYLYGEIGNTFNSLCITDWRRFAFEPREMAFCLVLLMTWTAYFYSGREKGPAETAVLILASIMGFMAVRNTPLFVLLVLPAMALHFDGVLQRVLEKARRGKQLSGLSIYIVAVLLTGLSVFFVVRGLPDRWQVKVDREPLPFQTVAFMNENNFIGNLWVPLHWGGYVIYHLSPQIKVSIDGRWTTAYPLDVRKENIEFAYRGTGGRWKELLDKYGADFALVERDNPALQEMSENPDWVWVFIEACGGLLVRKDYLSSINIPLKIPGKITHAWP